MIRTMINSNFTDVNVLFLFLILWMSGCEKNTSAEVDTDPPQETEFEYDILQLGEIPIGLWVTPPPSFQNHEEYRNIKESGINFINGFMFHETNYNAINKVLNLCQDNDLKYFTSKAIVHENIVKYSNKPEKNLLEKFTREILPYADHPAFAGELLMDEPGKPLFQSISAFTKAFEEQYPSKLAHVNLFPSYATGGIQTANYEDYINSWINTQNPKHISYDSYPLLTDGSIISDYFYNLDLIRTKTKFKRIPFWTFIQTLSIAGTPGVPDKREPSEADIRWQVWSNLAFGAKGIQYFCYWTPGSGTEQFGDALIDKEGNKTIRYNYVKNLNSDINTIGRILLGCDAEGVILTGSSAYKMYDPLYEFGDIESISGNEGIVGCFTSEEGERMVLVTTLTPTKGTKIAMEVKSNVSSVKKTINNMTEEINVYDRKLTLEVDPGEAVLIEF